MNVPGYIRPCAEGTNKQKNSQQNRLDSYGQETQLMDKTDNYTSNSTLEKCLHSRYNRKSLHIGNIKQGTQSSHRRLGRLPEGTVISGEIQTE